ncbi:MULTISPECIES: hypothetical protein [Plesiomonas]|nr:MULTISPECIES: hypothetical protein [Plesiomonas]
MTVTLIALLAVLANNSTEQNLSFSLAVLCGTALVIALKRLTDTDKD